MLNIKDKVILITGASSGIGEACARLFASHGANLIVTARRIERLRYLSEALQAEYQTKCFPLELDIRDRNAVESAIKALPASWRSIDILINNAGLALSSDPIQKGLPENWDTMIDTNVKGLLYVTHAILPDMLKRKKGHIVNIGSIAGQGVYPNGNVYCATKHAVRAITQSMRMDLMGTPVRVTEIAPGAVETEFSTVRWNDEQKAKQFYQDFNPLVADDIADAIYYCVTRPLHVDIAEMTIMPTDQASCNFISREKGKK
ncbi:SDR family oxidoreductase [Legionella spiritensis]|uniref:NADP-dependent L-serine/L-allo-threonine dehydrogenase ydfG n=1 Tax=Legionella spiritensis TaxID=452 RepID=A0A0W0Z4N0_LEGSP|nr:SDR family oxidoreductase [Legionella spiritensis]KTD64082.1 NADP-dependent L-serine/L-allo-threonine dehydrogenase ydfG [Legionella spiritensis]SNV37654.1 L-allo-threonine dehydrogenase, NAD(P)-binding [Legionella spiritensis]